MLTVNTKAYGIIDIDERQKLYFPYGIFGFETLKDFVLFDAVQQPFYWLQSLEVKETAFVLINPLVVRKDYKLDIISGDLEEIDLNGPDDENILMFAIVTIPENHKRMSANLQGPIVINKEKKIGRQTITVEPKWKTKHFILDELSGGGDKAC